MRIEVVVASSMKSIVSSQKGSDLLDPLCQAGDLSLVPEPSVVNVPEAGCAAQNQLDKVFKLFSNDPMAADVLAAKAIGMNPAEAQAALEIDAKTYATTLRRIARRLAD